MDQQIPQIPPHIIAWAKDVPGEEYWAPGAEEPVEIPWDDDDILIGWVTALDGRNQWARHDGFVTLPTDIEVTYCDQQTVILRNLPDLGWCMVWDNLECGTLDAPVAIPAPKEQS